MDGIYFYVSWKGGKKKCNISPKASTIIHELLAHHGIAVYEIEAIYEGKELPGSAYPGELPSMSGSVTTPTTVYEFWFDWEDGHYTLGEEDGCWEEVKDQTAYEAQVTREIQRRLRALGASHSSANGADDNYCSD